MRGEMIIYVLGVGMETRKDGLISVVDVERRWSIGYWM
jgi:hypothetical protein